MKIQTFIFIGMTSLGVGCRDDKESQVKPPPPPSSEVEVAPGSRILNIDQLFADLGLRRTRRPEQRGAGVNIAVIDKGFRGLEEALGKTLPKNVRVFQGNSVAADTSHGTEMLSLVKLAASGTQEPLSDGGDPTLYAFEANGLADLELQVQRIIDLGIPYVVYAQVWEATGNLDGTGIVDAVIEKALRAGVTWLNSAGNCADRSHYGKVEPNRTFPGELTLPGPQNAIWINHGSKDQGPLPSPFEITLAWNDWRDDLNHVTTMDLDLFLLDESGRVVGESSAEQGTTETRHPREKISANLPAGRYQIKVKFGGRTPIRFQGFNQNSRFWLVGNGAQIRFENGDSSRSVLNPANHPEVITVTASDVDYASYRADGLKPDLKTPSIVKYASGQEVGGSSTAVALAMGALASYMSEHGLLNRKEIFDLLKSGKIVGTQKLEGLEHLSRFPALYLDQ